MITNKIEDEGKKIKTLKMKIYFLKIQRKKQPSSKRFQTAAAAIDWKKENNKIHEPPRAER